MMLRHMGRKLGFGILLISGMLLAGCAGPASHVLNANHRVILAVGAENQYANVTAQIGGTYVSVSSLISNPSTDPHSYEATTSDAIKVGQAELVVQNGLGYDQFVNKLESATSNSQRTVIDVGQSLHMPMNTLNPHLWYDSKIMPKVAILVEQALSKLDPSHAPYFLQNLHSFDYSLQTWTNTMHKIKLKFPHAPVMVTEPVADDMLETAGLSVVTPWPFQAAVMNGVDPSPQSVQQLEQLIASRRIKVFVYNLQAVDTVTQTLLQLAITHHVPVVGVYETMPTAMNYQQWMTAEANAIYQALANGKSTQKL